MSETRGNCPNTNVGQGIDPSRFYGAKKCCPSSHSSNNNLILPPQHSLKFSKLLGPSTTWKIFKKQDELINFVSQNNCDLLPFTFQSENGNRLFLAAHPETFWHYDQQRDMKDRNSYEIIQEFKKCKLYFDLEFDITLNSDCDGHHMVDSFIDLVRCALKYRYDVICNNNDVLNLDSSTNSKFSCHLIFQLKNEIFCDNYNVGFFVKQLCHEIRLWIHKETENKNLLLLPTLDSPLRDIAELEIIDSKGNKKLFCDEGVYSKNRHFRLYKSSKFGKNAPLLVSKSCQFEIIDENPVTKEEKLFLYSLITWITMNKYNRFLQFPPNELHYALKIRSRMSNYSKNRVEDCKQSPFPDVDECITKIVSPGKIWRSVFFQENSTIVYDIVENRFCMNIERAHKSNNVKYVVDLQTLTYYQKCYDPDCADFKSPKKSLPINEHFFLNNNIDDDLILMAGEQCQPFVCTNPVQKSSSANFFSPNFHDENHFEIAKKGKSFPKKCSPHSIESVFPNEACEQEMISVAERCEKINEDVVLGANAGFSDDVMEGEIAAIADRCELEMNHKFEKTSFVTNLFSSDVDDLLIVSAAEKCELQHVL